jgi:hypothetical protein
MRFLIRCTFLLAFLLISENEIFGQRYQSDNCETVSRKLDGVRNILVDDHSKSKLILIAFRGRSETRHGIGKRRLYAVKEYLISKGVARDVVISAESVGADKIGSIKLYLNGGIIEHIFAAKNKDIDVGFCDNSVEDRKRFQLPK